MKTLYFLLAGGLGTRTKPLSQIKPKPAFPLGGKPLIDIMLSQIKRFDLDEGVVNLHWLPESVVEAIEPGNRPGIHFTWEEELSGSRILTDALEYMEDDDLLLVVNGDIFLDIPFNEMKEKLLKEGSDGILLVRQNNDPNYRKLLVSNNRFQGRGPIPGTGNTGDLTGSTTLYNKTIYNIYMYTGVALLRKKVIHRIDYINFFDALEAHPDLNISILPHQGIWLDIGDPRTYMEADRSYKKHIGSSKQNSLSNDVHISKDSKVSGCIVWERTRIERGSVINGCIITGDVKLENAKHENQIIFADGSGIQIIPLSPA